MDANQIALITAVASLLTAIATLFTVRELKNQRSAQHRPELIVEDISFRALRAEGESAIPAVTLAPIGKRPNEDEWHGALPIAIKNVGRGVARDVTARWSYDAHAFAELLAPYEQSIGGRVWIDDNSVQMEGSEKGVNWYATRNHDWRLGAIMPHPATDEKPLSADFAYSRMAATFFGAISQPQNFAVMDQWEIPPLGLVVAYRDVEGKRYTKNLVLRYQLVVMSAAGLEPPEDGWTEIVRGQLLVADA